MKKSSALEIVPDFNSPDLTKLGAAIVGSLQLIGHRTQEFRDEIVYEIVRAGWLLDRAKKSVGHTHFLPFLAQNRNVANLNFSVSTAENYMRGFYNSGLPEDCTEADFEKLKAAKKLHGLKPTDLYKLKDSAEDRANAKNAGQMEFDAVKEALQALYKDCDQAIVARGHMTDVQFEVCWQTLKSTLEALTDSPWDMIDRETGTPASQRGDARERKKGKK